MGTVLTTVAAWDLWALKGGHTALFSADAQAPRHLVATVALVVADAVLSDHL